MTEAFSEEEEEKEELEEQKGVLNSHCFKRCLRK